MRTVVRLALLLGMTAFGGPAWVAHAADEGASDVDALRKELLRFARRNAWAGVEETYQQMLAVPDAALTYDDHMLAFRAATQLGLTADGYERLGAAKQLSVTDEVVEGLARIEKRFGRVDIRGSWRRRPFFDRARMPFEPDLRQSIEHAEAVVEEAGSFRGWLPEGTYLVGDVPFEVVSGREELVVDVRRPGAHPDAVALSDAVAEKGGFQKVERALVYLGPAVSLGGGLLFSPSDAAAVDLEPEEMLAGSLGLTAAVEIGLTHRFGLAPAVTYRSAWSSLHGAHHVAGWFAGIGRFGDLRVAVGPTYGVVMQRGYGVVDNLDRRQDGDPRPTSDLQYAGTAFGGGAMASVGYGVVDLEPMVLQVELSAAWQGGPRSYVMTGVQLALVPKVPAARASR